jgi:aerobic-type carbon monoxide dehydrogenase small subunit (CoxS/CutS family)
VIKFDVNGESVTVGGPPMARLLDVLREDLRLTGSKEGCGEGECGACTVLVDGEAVNSCLIPVIQVAGCDVQTVEGMCKDGRLAPVQKAFIEHGAAQCGICTPGFIVTAKALLRDNPHPTRREAREAFAGNLCRCTGYQKIIDAAVSALARS